MEKTRDMFPFRKLFTNHLKGEFKMKTNTMIKVLSVMTALLLMTACSSEIEDTLIQQPDGKEYTTIPFSATVSTTAQTRAGLNGSTQYVFETGDKLYVEGTGVYGYLTLKAEDAGKRTGATFEGNLNISGTPAADLTLNAILVSSTDALHTISGDKVTATTYPTIAIAATEAEAIQKYSHFTGSATYGTPSFTLNQQSAFISFDVTLVDNTATSTAVDVSISNDGGVVRTGSTTTTTVGTDIKAQFVAAFPGGSTTLSNASITLGTRPAISFGGSTALAVNKIYQVTKGYVDLSKLDCKNDLTPTMKDGYLLTGNLGEHNQIRIADKATVTLKDVSIHLSYFAAGVGCEGDATIILEGLNDVAGACGSGGGESYPGVHVPTGKTLTIQGSGSLAATSGGKNNDAAGIGGSSSLNIDCGNIVIKGGVITATGRGDAGIGGGSGNISIEGGYITAIGGTYCAGIGGRRNGACGTITITGDVTYLSATKGWGAPNQIGAGDGGTCGTVTIDGVDNATTASSFTHFSSTITTTTNTNDTWILTNNAPASTKALSAVTSSEVGWRIGSDGNAYSPVGTLPGGVTAVAIIAYVGAAGSVDASSAYKGLAIAMSDANGGNTCQWYTSNDGTCTSNQTTDEATVITYKDGIANTTKLAGGCGGGHTHSAASFADNNNSTSVPTGTSGWFLPSIGQWQLIVQGLTGGTANLRINVENETYKASSVNAKIIVAGGTGIRANDYWSCSEWNSESAWFIRFSEGSVNGYGKNRTTDMYVRSALAF